MDDMVEKTIQNGLSLGKNESFRFQSNAERFKVYALMIEIMHDDIVKNYEQKIRAKYPHHIEDIDRILFSLGSARANILDMRDIAVIYERRENV